jgi:AcrR family transcriptional regulator
MNQATSPVEEKIIQATIECIEKYGLQGTTNRRIAAQAGVNGAAINYYFRSKEALIEKCMQRTLENAFDWEDFTQAVPNATPQERCEQIFNDLIQGACNYPGLTRAHFYDLLFAEKGSALVLKHLSQFLVTLAADLRENGVDLSGKELYLAVAQMTAGTMMLTLVPDLFEKSFGLELCDEQTRQEYVHRLVEKLLK